MKKLFYLVLAVVLCVSLCAVAESLLSGSYSVGGDLPAGWYSLSTADGSELSLIYLPEGSAVTASGSMTLTPVSSRSFTCGAGVYVAGEDFPAGKYSIYPIEGHYDYVNYRIEGPDGGRLLGGVLHKDDGEYIGNINLVEGCVCRFDEYGVRFVPSAGGVIFD